MSSLDNINNRRVLIHLKNIIKNFISDINEEGLIFDENIFIKFLEEYSNISGLNFKIKQAEDTITICYNECEIIIKITLGEVVVT